MKKRLFALSLLLVSAFMFSGCLDIVTSRNESGMYTQSPSEVAEEVIDSVVTVFVVDGQTDSQINMGSGVCIRDGGYIVTNYHVIYRVLQNDNLKIEIYLNGGNVGYESQLLWSNSNLDVAILRCEKTDIPYVNAVDRVIYDTNRLSVLEPVIAIGTPLDFAYQNSCTFGYVSGLNRYSLSSASNGLSQNVYENLIQHTASISNGNSGGGLFDMNGYLIGLNTLGSNSGNEMYFAVPIYPILLVLDEIVECDNNGTQYTLSSLGVSVVDSIICDIYNYDIIQQEGLYVTEVSGNSENIIQVGDIIVAMNTSNNNFDISCRNDLIYALMQMSSGDIVTIEILRNDEKIDVEVTLS